jgi:signal transduction histidine kinase
MTNSSVESIVESPATEHRRWGWVLLAGIAIPLLSLVLARLLTATCSGLAHAIPSVYKQDWHVTLALCRSFPDLYGCEPGVGLFSGQEIVDLCDSVGAWAGPLFGLLLATGGAIWITHRGGVATTLPGVGVGLISALSGSILLVLYDQKVGPSGGAQGLWNLLMLFLIVGGSWLGGVLGRATLAGRAALRRASQAIAAASDAQAIVSAVGEHLAGPEVSHVSLWETESPAEAGTPEGTLAGIQMVAAWTARDSQAPPAGLRLDAAEMSSLRRFDPKAPLLVQTRSASPTERAAWERIGIRSALLLPLTATGGRWVGVLMVGSRTARGVRRGIWRTEVLGNQVALAVQNLRLVERGKRAAVLDERQRLAREIHDTLAQGFTSIVMHLEAAEGALPGEWPAVRQHLDQARRTARESLVQARRLVWALRPAILERTSLPTAVERVVARWMADTGITARTTMTGAACPLPPAAEITLLRAVQEALTNIRKHARAHQVAVTLSYMGDVVVLDVQDDGAGFDPTEVQAPPAVGEAGGFGLAAMRERVEELGGTLLVESAPDEGTTLVVEIPVPNRFEQPQVE